VVVARRHRGVRGKLVRRHRQQAQRRVRRVHVWRHSEMEFFYT
jgi:hypothetical protein